MSQPDKKASILNVLTQASCPLTLHDLIKKMGDHFTERTVRRWLSELVHAGLVEKIGQKRGTKYQIRSGTEIRTNRTASYFSPQSIKVLTVLQRPVYERNPVIYNDQWMDSYIPNATFYISLEWREQLQILGQRSREEDPAGTYAHQIFNRLLIDLSYNSSRLEGNTYSLLDTERLVLEGSSAEGKLDEEKIMILNHKEAIRYLVDNAAKLVVNEVTLRTLHFLLSDGLIKEKYAGKLRDHSVRVGGSVYIPFEDRSQIENRFHKMIHKAAAIINPHEQSLFFMVIPKN